MATKFHSIPRTSSKVSYKRCLERTSKIYSNPSFLKPVIVTFVLNSFWRVGINFNFLQRSDVQRSSRQWTRQPISYVILVLSTLVGGNHVKAMRSWSCDVKVRFFTVSGNAKRKLRYILCDGGWRCWQYNSIVQIEAGTNLNALTLHSK